MLLIREIKPQDGIFLILSRQKYFIKNCLLRLGEDNIVLRYSKIRLCTLSDE